MQSSDYVPGVSGWKIDPATGTFELASDRVTVSGVDPAAKYSGRMRGEQPTPFVVIDGVIYIRGAEVERGKIANTKVDGYGIKLHLNANGDYVAAGCGLGIDSQCLVSADKFAIKQPTEFEKALAKGAGAVLELLAGTVSETELGQDLQGKIDQIEGQQDQIREVIRGELRPGGLLHRS